MKRIFALYAVLGIILWATYAVVNPTLEVKSVEDSSGIYNPNSPDTYFTIQRVKTLGDFLNGGFSVRYYNRIIYKGDFPEEESAGIMYGITLQEAGVSRNTVTVRTKKMEDGSRQIIQVQLNGQEIPVGALRDWALNQADKAFREGRQRLGIS